MRKYEVKIYEGFGEPHIVTVNTSGDFPIAVRLALDKYPESLDDVTRIECEEVHE